MIDTKSAFYHSASKFNQTGRNSDIVSRASSRVSMRNTGRIPSKPRTPMSPINDLNEGGLRATGGISVPALEPTSPAEEGLRRNTGRAQSKAMQRAYDDRPIQEEEGDYWAKTFGLWMKKVTQINLS